MVRFETHAWSSRLQHRLDGDSFATMEVSSGDAATDAGAGMADESSATAPGDGLTFGPYGSSPLRGLNFDTSTDTAAS